MGRDHGEDHHSCSSSIDSSNHPPALSPTSLGVSSTDCNNIISNGYGRDNSCDRRDLSTDLRLGLSISPSRNDLCSTSTQREQRFEYWPPIKPLLRSTLAGKADNHPQQQQQQQQRGHASLFVKVYMEGIPIGRKLDLFAHEGYNALITTLAHMFRTTILCPDTDGVQYSAGKLYHVLTYEDKEGDWMMVGDVPWDFRDSGFRKHDTAGDIVFKSTGEVQDAGIVRPTANNLVPIRLDIETEGQRHKDAFTWNPSDPDSEVVVFAKRTVKDLKLPPQFITRIAQSIQSQLTEFKSYEGQDMYTAEKIVPIKLDLRVNHTLIKDHFLWDLNKYESDPEEVARTFCRDMGTQDPEVGIAIRSVMSAREIKISKKGLRGVEHVSASKAGGNALDLMRLFRYNSSVVRKKREWDVFEPIVDILSNEEVDALEAREERTTR